MRLAVIHGRQRAGKNQPIVFQRFQRVPDRFRIREVKLRPSQADDQLAESLFIKAEPRRAAAPMTTSLRLMFDGVLITI